MALAMPVLRVSSHQPRLQTMIRRRLSLNGRRWRRNVRSHTVKPRKPAVMKRRPAAGAHKEDVVGNERKLPINAAMRFASVFVSRLVPNESESTIKNYLESTLELDVKVELCKLSNTQSSFHIACLFPNPTMFISDDPWPEGMYRRWWRQPRVKSDTAAKSDNAVQQVAAPIANVTITPTPAVSSSDVTLARTDNNSIAPHNVDKTDVAL